MGLLFKISTLTNPIKKKYLKNKKEENEKNLFGSLLRYMLQGNIMVDIN